jgi:hypothetical protein
MFIPSCTRCPGKGRQRQAGVRVTERVEARYKVQEFEQGEQR